MGNQRSVQYVRDDAVTFVAVLSASTIVRETVTTSIGEDERLRVVASLPVTGAVDALRNIPFDLLIAHVASKDECNEMHTIATQFSSKLIVVIINQSVNDPESLAQHHGIDVVASAKKLEQVDRLRRLILDAAARFGVSVRRLSAADQLDREHIALLTNREREIMVLTAEGLTVKEIANRLHRSPSTIETHRENIMRKVGLRDRVALTRLAIRTGLIEA